MFTMTRTTQVSALLGSAAAMALMAGSAQAQTIVGSKHDLSAASSNTDEICVFCHTPHAAENARGPLWNRAATTLTYSLYNSTTMDVAMGDGTTLGSVSLACLSCHDGVTARDALVNFPGSGTAAWTSSLGTLPLSGGNDLAAVGASGDLTNDHPIGMRYAGAITGGDALDPNMVAATTADSVYFIETTGSGQDTTTGRQKDDLPLYNYNSSWTVECATCHDPHNGTTNQLFLRISNAGSKVCLSCHVK